VNTFRVTIEGLDLAAARSALVDAGIQPHGAGWDQHPGEYGEVVAPQIRAQIEADDAEAAAERVREALPGDDYMVKAEAL
jgi:hypothetical protein